MSDVRHALRVAWRSPRHSLTVVLTLTLGIAATTAVFSVANAVLLEPLPYPHPDRIVALGNSSRDGFQLGVSAPRFLVWRDTTTVFEDAAAYVVRGSMNLRRGAGAEQVIAGRASVEFFELFGASFAAGRGFVESEDRPAGGRVVVLNNALWRNQFGGARDVLGTTVVLNDLPYTVVGILSASFDPRSATPFVSARPDLWIPLQIDPQDRSDANNLLAAARLRSGVSLDQARADTDRATANSRRRFPGVMRPAASLAVMPLHEMVAGRVRGPLTLLIAAVAFLLLLTCANIACLVLIRTIARSGEWALRAAAGASRGRIIRQLLIENLVLAIPGCVLGIAMGMAGIHALLAIQPGDIPRIASDGSDVVADWRVVWIAITASAISAIAFGAVPALFASRVNLQQPLNTAGARSATASGFGRTRAVLVVTEVAIASVLLVAAALLVRSFVSLRAVEPGFDARNVVMMRVVPSGPSSTAAGDFAQRLQKTTGVLKEQPGVLAVAATLTGAPLEGENSMLKIEPVGRSDDTGMVGSWRVVTPGYFGLFRIPLLRGRLFADTDTSASEPVVIITRSLAARFWTDRDPLNDRLLLGRGGGPDFADVPRRIVGVVGDTRQASLDQPAIPGVFVPIAQLPAAETAFFTRLNVPTTWLLRVADNSASTRDRMREQLRQTTAAAVTAPTTMDDVAALSMAQRRFDMVLMAAFALAAMLLSTLGVYGVCAYSVQQRTREIGIRMALGARGQQVRSLVFTQAVRLTIAGETLGLIGASVAVTALRTLLYGVSGHDPAVFTTVPLVLLAAAWLAAWIPARHAARLELNAALRSE
jgi:predicted permease